MTFGEFDMLCFKLELMLILSLSLLVLLLLFIIGKQSGAFKQDYLHACLNWVPNPSLYFFLVSDFYLLVRVVAKGTQVRIRETRPLPSGLI